MQVLGDRSEQRKLEPLSIFCCQDIAECAALFSDITPSWRSFPWPLFAEPRGPRHARPLRFSRGSR